MENQKNGLACKRSILLELTACNDLSAFVAEVEQKGFDINEASLWYARSTWSKKMGYEERTPLLIAAMFGSLDILNYIIASQKVDVNKACGADGFTALHCAVTGGANSSIEVVKLLLEASADVNASDANGNKPADLLPVAVKSPYASRRKIIESMLKGDSSITQEEVMTPRGTEKKEYPVDVSLPDINLGVYGSDEFRMYSFKIKPCSRAYSHDWTECPFVHPGENARRRDPSKFPYSCVPCPEFRKGSCPKSDGCEYAHGVFESWLHPAQYRTRLCKDEVGCARKVCFFAHKPEELRPVYASTGSAMPSPRSMSGSPLEMTFGSSSMPMATASTPPASTSPKSGNLWQNRVTLTPPALQLPGSRLKTAYSARDLDFASQLKQQQQMIDEMCNLSSPTCWENNMNKFGEPKPTNLEDVFGSLDPSVLSPLHALSMNSPTSLQMRQNLNQNMNQMRASYPTNPSPSPARSYGFDSSAAVAAAVMNSRSSAFQKRSQSFIDRGVATNRSGLSGAANSGSMMSSSEFSNWGSPGGKLDWGVQGDELNKLKRSSSFGFRRSLSPPLPQPPRVEEPDVSWVNSLVKDEKQNYLHGNNGTHDKIPHWLEQMYIEQEQMVA
ncbi:hypothetical protein ACFE04_030865 [Oxalis oulophora]